MIGSMVMGLRGMRRGGTGGQMVGGTNAGGMMASEANAVSANNRLHPQRENIMALDEMVNHS